MTSIIIDAGLRETYTKEKKLNGFVTHLMSFAQVQSNKAGFSNEQVQQSKAIFFFGPKKDIDDDAVEQLVEYLENGNHIFVFASSLPPKFASFLATYGLLIKEPVISPRYITYLDPRHVTIQGGIINKAILQWANEENMTFAYPYGSTIETNIRSSPILSTGLSAYPLTQPTLGKANVGRNNGILVLMGSEHAFCDEWLKKEHNEKLLEFLIKFVITEEAHLYSIDEAHPDLQDRFYTPDIIHTSEQVKCCISESEKMKGILTNNFEMGLFKMDMSFVAKTKVLADQIGINSSPLTMVIPQFDTALPGLTPAVFPPQMKEPKPPELDLFDLDDSFAEPKTRLAQLAQKTSAKNAEKFIIQAAKVLGIFNKLPEGKRDGKGILQNVLEQIVKWKRMHQ